MAVRIFEVGGSVRDAIIGVPNKDRDFAVEAPSWDAMRAHVRGISTKIFMEKPEFLTIRAMVRGEPMDFVLCRKDGPSSDARRPDSVSPGTIAEDLARRDFTVNAIARDVATGEILDPFGGIADLSAMRLRCVGSARERFAEDSLRIIRAIRFAITKGFTWDAEIAAVLADAAWATRLHAVSVERIRDELIRCFKTDTVATIRTLASIHPAFSRVMFEDMGIWLDPTTKAK